MNTEQDKIDLPRCFSIERQDDESGVSGVGLVLDGAIFPSGVTVIHWRTPKPIGSTAVYQSFDQFMSIHVGPHPTNRTRFHWDDGTVWEPGEYQCESFAGPKAA